MVCVCNAGINNFSFFTYQCLDVFTFAIGKGSSAFKLSSLMQMQNPGCMVMVDNCYGEFVDDIEPPMVVCKLFLSLEFYCM